MHYTADFCMHHYAGFLQIGSHMSSICTLLAFAAGKKLQVHQMDVVSAFLNGEFTEEIYMKQPPGYGTDQRQRRKRSRVMVE